MKMKHSEPRSTQIFASESEEHIRWKPYPTYKDSGVEWLGKIPEDWEITKIKHLAQKGYKTFIDGDWIESPFITNEGIRLIQTGNIGVGEYKEQGFRFISEETFYEFNCTEVIPGDVLICRLATPVGRACQAPIIDNRMITSVDVCILKPSSFYDSRFVVFFLSSIEYLSWINAISRGSTRDRISRYMLGNINIVAPPIREQIRISSFLDRETSKIDALIARKQRLIELLQEKRTALISQAVTKGLDPNVPMKDSGVEWLGEIPHHWEVKRIKHVTLKIGSGKTPRGGNQIYKDSGVIFIRSQNVHFDGLRLDDVVYIDEKIDEEMQSTQLKPDDVLLNITGASLGRVTIVPQSFPNANINQHVSIVRPNTLKINPAFLNLTLSSSVVQSQIFSTENGAAREGLPYSKIANLIFAMPLELTEQKLISDHVNTQFNRNNKLIAKVEVAIGQLREYQSALISAAVTGKIDVR
jgi:type I restriction enzyme, S subunit